MRMLSVLLLLAAAPAAEAQTVKFTTEEYPPYNYREGDGYGGAGYEQVVEMMKTVGVDYTVELMPWARALALAESERDHCVFTTAHIPERDARFKWVEPLAIDRNFMISKSGTNVEAKNVEEARQYIVGTQRNDYTQDLLQRNGFPKIDLAADLDLTLKKLLAGRIDMMPISEKYYTKLKAEGNPVEAEFVFSKQTFSIACNIDFPADLQKKMQDALSELIANGTQARILEAHGLGGLGETTAELQ
ncbi:transporter substrate-binding domain-containing protein [Ciceribacter sp. L1K22]|uniref:substrate-binding periplasmic protein n=1 Tax=Ciceribacter sp. L1K22 TaxID=2820275 RepID=UPI001ABE9749|nr:transporter substrate-binding domain-containing protein [Ciceribacter sp. L1K22]MBO3761008.1 transporter substrate-binding domain-containing protein [Ciceribacter sp. L1K22]